MVIGHTRPRNKIDSADEDQKQFTPNRPVSTLSTSNVTSYIEV
jgi:hypothetical protein